MRNVYSMVYLQKKIVTWKQFFVLFPFRKTLKSFLILSPLLGLTWVFGLLAVTDAGLVFQYVFTILNSTQVCTNYVYACRFGQMGLGLSIGGLWENHFPTLYLSIWITKPSVKKTVCLFHRILIKLNLYKELKFNDGTLSNTRFPITFVGYAHISLARAEKQWSSCSFPSQNAEMEIQHISQQLLRS